MADREDINPLNTAGQFYVDISCIDCDLCRENLPTVFQRDDDEGLSYVHKQPKTRDEIKKAYDAIKNCPTESIGS